MKNKNKQISTIVVAGVVIVLLLSVIVAAATGGEYINIRNNSINEGKEDTPTPKPEETESTATPHKTDLPSSTPTPTSTAVDTETPTRSNTQSTAGEETENIVRHRKILYNNFMPIYVEALENNSVNVSGYNIDPKNESAVISWTQEPGNSTAHVLDRQTALANYAYLSNEIRERENLTTKAVPKRMYYSIHSPDGDLYMLTHIDYLDAFEYSEGTISSIDYQAEYEKNAEYGPAHPRYEENQTATAASA